MASYFHSDEWYRQVFRHCYQRRHRDDAYRRGARWAIGRLKRRSDMEVCNDYR